VRHYTSPKFWEFYQKRPRAIQKLADKNFEILKNNPYHPSLLFKKSKPFLVGKDWIRLSNAGG